MSLIERSKDTPCKKKEGTGRPEEIRRSVIQESSGLKKTG